MAVFPYATPLFQPAIRQIAAISSVLQAGTYSVLLITTTQNHLYNNGLTVRLNIPLEYGAQQLNGIFSEIIITSPTQFTMTYDQSPYDPFVIPATPLQAPLTIPIAENVLLLNSAVTNVLP
jgi:hypothetical protein